MLYLIAFFLPPLAVLFAGKPFQSIVSFVLWVFAWVGLIFFVVPGVILWLLLVVHAFKLISDNKADRRAREIADAVRHAR
ncbi:hypothetical protein [Roseiterribacter gracilis]|uniref:Proteolipid membrane potential modulator n=1 Tax=Roseiterribacter gracilis TaxID=2812848 RepID=A0A8S8XGT8_9PROT|nr:proteolipid membrane potential modulator [Rhodospirillales bacterium TMPK1]